MTTVWQFHKSYQVNVPKKYFSEILAHALLSPSDDELEIKTKTTKIYSSCIWNRKPYRNVLLTSSRHKKGFWRSWLEVERSEQNWEYCGFKWLFWENVRTPFLHRRLEHMCCGKTWLGSNLEEIWVKGTGKTRGCWSLGPLSENHPKFSLWPEKYQRS